MDGFNPNDSQARMDALFSDIKAMFYDLKTQMDMLKERQDKIRAGSVDLSVLQTRLDEARKYTDDKMEAGIKRGERALDDKISLARSGILSETEKAITLAIKEWEREQFSRLLDDLLEAREKQVRKDREMQWQRVKNRASTAGSIIVLLTAAVTFYFAFRGDTEPKHLKHLDRVGDAVLDIQ